MTVQAQTRGRLSQCGTSWPVPNYADRHVSPTVSQLRCGLKENLMRLFLAEQRDDAHDEVIWIQSELSACVVTWKCGIEWNAVGDHLD
jgi:hypothetical protein